MEKLNLSLPFEEIMTEDNISFFCDSMRIALYMTLTAIQDDNKFAIEHMNKPNLFLQPHKQVDKSHLRQFLESKVEMTSVEYNNILGDMVGQNFIIEDPISHTIEFTRIGYKFYNDLKTWMDARGRK